MVKCMCYTGLRFNGYFETGAASMDDHCRTDIIGDVGHSMLDSVVPLVLCTVAYNIRGI